MAYEVDKQGNLNDGENTILVTRESHGNAPEPPSFTYHAEVNGEKYEADSPAELAKLAPAVENVEGDSSDDAEASDDPADDVKEDESK